MNWLNDAVVYEIYPQSFYDTNGDGIGDLEGIIQKLDYIQECGFTDIWLNPICDSTFYDAGYDVTDFYKVAPRYGTNDDYKRLCDEVHKRGMHIIFDLVAGHTSVNHPWFLQSAKDEKNQYTNRYIWTSSTFNEDADGYNCISGSHERDGKYVTNFFWSQPALNYGFAHPNNDWQLPVTHPDCIATKEELKNIIKFWMELGTDAFRVDMAASLIKGDTDGSFTKALWGEIRQFMENINPRALLIAEWGSPADAINAGYHLDFLLHSHNKAYTSLFRYEDGRNTTDLFIGNSYFSKEGKGDINNFLDRFLYDLENTKGKGYVGLITGNHDIPRLAYKRDEDELKTALAFIFTMPGVPFVYYGDEIGMDYIDNLPSKEGGYNRTGSRTPMQWNNDKNHGFSTSDMPYLPTDQRDTAPTVEKQERDENSVLSFTKKLIEIHKNHKALSADGEFKVVVASYPFVFERTDGKEKIFVAINPSDKELFIERPQFEKVLLSHNAEIGEKIKLKSAGFVILQC
ncbi:MAG: glycosylase [Clostridia bacterium]|nr:glycosylase [Clostridia bacterium]